MKPRLKFLLVVVVLSVLCSTTAIAGAVELTFTFWGDALEARVVTQVCEDFNKIHPDIRIVPMHIPQYLEKISAMIASGNPPHIGYLVESRVIDWAESDILVDLATLLQIDPDPIITNKLPQLCWWYDGGTKLAGVSFAAEFMITYYNKDLFDKANVPYPPTNPEDWTWEKFVETAKKLTFDKKGRRPGEPEFDPNNIVQYGAVIGGAGTSPWVLYPLIWSNNGDVVDETGWETKLDSSETIEALQKCMTSFMKSTQRLLLLLRMPSRA